MADATHVGLASASPLPYGLTAIVHRDPEARRQRRAMALTALLAQERSEEDGPSRYELWLAERSAGRRA